MKQFLTTGIGILVLALTLQAQQNAGTVIYDRVSRIQFSFSGMPGGMEQQMPSTRTDKFELVFGNNQSLWKQAESDNEDNGSFTTDNGAHIRMIVAGSNDVLYTDLEKGRKVENRELMDKNFIIDDTITRLKWKMTGETKTILDHNCMKATSTRTSKRTIMNMDNGVMERKEVNDTSVVIAWFAMDIPVSAGPSEFQGQLPGLILEMDIKDGTQIYKAVQISEKADLASIKEPNGKKRYTSAEFAAEREKMMKEMEKNNSGGRRIIRMN